MKLRNLIGKAQRFVQSPQGRRLIGKAAGAVRGRTGGSGGAGRASGLTRALDMAQRYADGGRPSGQGPADGPGAGGPGTGSPGTGGPGPADGPGNTGGPGSAGRPGNTDGPGAAGGPDWYPSRRP